MSNLNLLFDQINNEIKQAMLHKQGHKLRALRGLKGALTTAKTKESAGEFTLDDAYAVVRKQLKQRQESAEIYKVQSRPDLEELELAEIPFLEEFIPKQISDELTKSIVQRAIMETGATSMRDMKRVIEIAKDTAGGGADPSLIAKYAKELLSQPAAV